MEDQANLAITYFITDLDNTSEDEADEASCSAVRVATCVESERELQINTRAYNRALLRMCDRFVRTHAAHAPEDDETTSDVRMLYLYPLLIIDHRCHR